MKPLDAISTSSGAIAAIAVDQRKSLRRMIAAAAGVSEDAVPGAQLTDFKQAVMAGMGISLLSLHTLSLELRTGEIALLDVTGTPIERVWHVAHMASKRLSPASESCRAYLLEHAAEFLGKEYAGLLPGRRVA